MSFDFELRTALLNDLKTRSVFGGVLPVDQLPKYRLRRKPRLYIINTDESTGPGKHWVLVYFYTHSRSVYFDSYGMDVADHRITDFIKKNALLYYYNNRVLQGALSQTCGYYCVYVAKRLARGESLRKILQVFRTYNNYFNDMVVTRI